MSEARQPAIELIDAEIGRSRATVPTPVLHEVRWRINTGDFWVVGAAPGSGKTDLLSTAAALQRPLKGYHLLFGKDTREMDEQELVLSHKRVGMVFDSGRLFPQLTVAANLALPLAYHSGESRKNVDEKVEHLLEVTGLRQLRDRYPSQITRNLHQRVSLARALMLDPEVLLIDNPLGGTDPKLGRWWLEFLCQLQEGHEQLERRPMTMVVTADDFRPWMDVARQFAMLSQGQFAVVGGREEVRAARDPAVQELLIPAFELA